ncbi:Sir2 family NAD-dependent protein deacetylase [Breznakiella homolactica]|uniref:protein acetyllysine N-acetyltransferase n=1 Tax=Breznakiella homolactica TaxID=2798577 RepID=A0A7T8B927_9SPIR|nr:Sir2 family NAD-dependent protein deacetylase [Breznakiella homolactica]QQO07911.1 NAD-dependent deacetylase [Breznakiella homolactica]
MDTSPELKALAELIRSARCCTALTGAGVSTLSGIRDFRGKNGLYTEFDADKIFDIEYFRRDPSYYYNAARTLFYTLDEIQPSIVHIGLARMEQSGLLEGIITQNIDLLHQKAGSRRVVEIHGSPSLHYCLNCMDGCSPEDFDADDAVRGNPAVMGFSEAAAIVRAGDMPRCGICGSVLKPGITFFGEALPAKALKNAEGLARKSDLMLVLGTSLTVYPAAFLPEYTLRDGGDIVLVNNMVTPMDSRAILRFDDLETVFSFLTSEAG